MKFDKAVSQAVSGNLKRIRIKIDPAYTSAENYRDIDSYEGYVLEECEETLRVMVIKTGMPIVDIPQEALSKPGHFEQFRTFVEHMLQLKVDSKFLIALNKANSYEEIEDLLDLYSCSTEEIAAIYREFLKSCEKDENEI